MLLTGRLPQAWEERGKAAIILRNRPVRRSLATLCMICFLLFPGCSGKQSELEAYLKAAYSVAGAALSSVFYSLRSLHSNS